MSPDQGLSNPQVAPWNWARRTLLSQCFFVFLLTTTRCPVLALSGRPIPYRLQDLAELEEDPEHFTEIDLSVFLSKNETV